MNRLSMAVSAAMVAFCALAMSQMDSSEVVSEPIKLAVVKGMPYSATRTMSVTNIGSNGQTTTVTVRSLMWRDAEGRTRQEDIQEVETIGETKAINISDPIARVHYSWNDGEQIDKRVNEVVVNHSPESWQEQNIWPGSASTPKQRNPRAPGLVPTNDPNIKFEILEPKELNGIYVEGQRITRVIPAGKEGNEHEVTVTSEKWTSPELKITIYNVRDDPRTGRTVMELTHVDRSNPAVSLFRPPADRPRRDVPPQHAH